ncbi:MAG: excinuclease ABC subunit UvrA, partial [Deltaproteobacteria bacterium]|nr:excinuclease ABC subunit UvrA [Deltaproteobacteria bacterium]
FFGDLRLEGEEQEVAELLVAEIRDRLQFLHDVGLTYLTLDRRAASLSGGEAQRIRLAAQVGSALRGVTYVLDEPSIGLHPRDNARLLATLRRLRDRGNSVLVVEHDAETIASADFVVDIGPGAGKEGGLVTAATTPGRFLRTNNLTARYLRGDERIDLPAVRRTGNGKVLRVRGARAHNLKDVDVSFPLGTFIVVTGVSGSGKSTLVFEVLQEVLSAALARRPSDAACDGVDGLAHVDKVIRISQQPIGRTPRSNPATYTSAFDVIRSLFAQTPEARARGYKKGRFSFNVHGGRCEACQGAGVKTVEMQFLPSVEVPCDVCAGRRFNAETLEITWKGHTIYDVLEMTVAEALQVFGPIPKLKRILGTMVEVGLAYVPLGQPSTTLSGGEAQRIKLAKELQRPATGRTLYLLDEPTTGLHFHDVAKLLHALDRLVEAGNTVVVIEHHPDVVKCADHLIDLGPEGGEAGGWVVGTGTPEAVAALDTPTGHALAALPELGMVRLAADAPGPRRPRRRRRSGGERALVIEGARKHNLRGIDVRIPHDKLTVITGVSGSGKSSLAFDTVFSEGQRQYVESLSTYARRFLGRMDRAPVDRVEGLAPAIAIDQRNRSHNPRSTVATVTEIHDVLRILYARVGTPHCPECGREVLAFSPSTGAVRLRGEAGRAGWLVTRLRPAEQPDERRTGLLKDGWSRLLEEEARREVRLDDGSANALLEEGALLVLDRLNPSRASQMRVAEAVANAYALGNGVAAFFERGGDGRTLLTERPTCQEHGEVLPEELTPRHFSFNSRLGACTRCDGLGVARRIDPERLFPEAKRGFWDAMDPRVRSVLVRSPRQRTLIGAVLQSLGLDDRTPVSGWTERQRDVLLEGSRQTFDLSWSQQWGRTHREVQEERPWPGLLDILEGWNSRLDWLTAERECPRCRGGRLREALLAVTIGGLGVHAFTRLCVDEALATVGEWRLEGEKAAIAERPLLELRRRLSFLQDVGLGYLELDRSAQSLSGGEAQRIRLASQLGGGLTGVIYVLDEPTIGLHA